MKIITGIRRCGKSSLMKLMILHLRDTGVADDQIIEINFESMDFRRMTVEELYRYVKERLPEKKRAYLFFDEIQRIDQWQDAVNSLGGFQLRHLCDRLQRLSAVLGVRHLPGRTERGDQDASVVLPGVSGLPRLYKFGRAKAPPKEYGSGSTDADGESYEPQELLDAYLHSAECRIADGPGYR